MMCVCIYIYIYIYPLVALAEDPQVAVARALGLLELAPDAVDLHVRGLHLGLHLLHPPHELPVPLAFRGVCRHLAGRRGAVRRWSARRRSAPWAELRRPRASCLWLRRRCPRGRQEVTTSYY